MKLSQGGPVSTWKGPYYHLFELQTHSLDLMRWFAGEVVAVNAQMAHPRSHQAKEGEYPCWTSMAIALRFENDAVGSLMASWDSDFVSPIERFEICGDKGEIIVDNVISGATWWKREEQVIEEYRPSIFKIDQLTFDGTFALRVNAFVNDLVAGRSPAPTGRDGLQTLRIVDAIIRSWEEKREVIVDRTV